MTLYDYEQDGDIKEDEVIIIYEDGTREHVKKTKLFKEVKSGEQRQPVKKHHIRSRPGRTSQHRKTYTRQAPPKRRLPLRKARPEE